jgi:polar amino acid transport system substrate-binding protein/cystine transport system substrate-binding protein
MRKHARAALLSVVAFIAIPAISACSPSQQTSPVVSGAAGEALVIGTSGTYRPITFSEGGKLAGYDIDWGTAIGEEIGRPVQFVEGPLQGLVTGLQSGKYDLVMSSLTITPEREATIDFSEPYLADGVVAVVLEDAVQVDDIADLEGLTVGVIGGSGYQTTVEAIGGYADLVEYQDAPSGFADLKNGRIDVFAAGRIPATTYVENDDDPRSELEVRGEPYELLPAGVGIAKGNLDLKAQVDEAIAHIKAQRTGDRLAEKWFGFTIPGYTD